MKTIRVEISYEITGVNFRPNKDIEDFIRREYEEELRLTEVNYLKVNVTDIN